VLAVIHTFSYSLTSGQVTLAIVFPDFNTKKAVRQLPKGQFPLHAYCRSKFGREAEFVVAVYLKSRGWIVKLSKGSRGPADIKASLGPLQVCSGKGQHHIA